MKLVKYGTLVLLILIIGIATYSNIITNHTSTIDRPFLYIDVVNKSLNHIVYQLDLDSNKERILLERELEDYPSSAYSKDKEKVFFTAKTGNNSVQLFEKNLKSNTTKQLTKNLYYVDFLQYNSQKQLIFMRVLIGRNDRNFHIATYDLRNKKISVWNEKDKDTSVVEFDYNPHTKQLLMVTKSIKEEFDHIHQANKKGVPVEPYHFNFSIYSENGTFEKDVLTLKKFVRSASLSSDSEKILINFKDSIEPNFPLKISEFEVAIKKLTLVFEDSEKYSNIRKPIYNNNNEGFFFIFEENKSEEPILAGVKFFDLMSKKIQHIWSQNDVDPVNIYLDK